MPDFDAEHWQARRRGADCALCPLIVAATTVAHSPASQDAERRGGEPLLLQACASGPVFLRPDADFRGWCMLVFRRHACELFDLSPAERAALTEDVSRVARAIQETCHPDKINYAMLGNEQPHLHVHVIPRYSTDGWWGKSPWARPADAERRLAADELRALAARLRSVFDG